MSYVLVTGSGGLIGSESCRKFAAEGFRIEGVDNDMRAYFFGSEASTAKTVEALQKSLPGYRHNHLDIRDREAVEALFKKLGPDLSGVIHTAAQPSHDWAAREPHTDFGVNALGTLNLLEAARLHAPGAVFIFTSTNKVYGDTPNRLPLVEQESRWEVDAAHPFFENGIDETMSIDQTCHSIFGASKVAADVMVQEYGRYFGLPTCCLRGGCLTGPNHSGVELHGFLSYLVKCNVEGRTYKIFGYMGKQVRDNIHAYDVARFIEAFIQAPRCGEVYNIGGGRFSNCSMLEAIALCEEISGKKLAFTYADENRIGDHIWWISDTRKFRSDYPAWKPQYGIREILSQIHEVLCS